MKTATLIVAVATLMASCITEQGHGGHDAVKTEPGSEQGFRPQLTCPVMEGKRISNKLYVDYQGVRIYVCCVPCVKAVKKNPAKYLRRLRDEGVSVEAVKEVAATENNETKSVKQSNGQHGK